MELAEACGGIISKDLQELSKSQEQCALSQISYGTWTNL